MKREDEQYEQWLRQVRNAQPVLRNPEQLTLDILQNISQTSKKKNGIRKKSAWFSAIAAGILLCFMMYETFFYSVAFRPMKDISRSNSFMTIRRSPSLPEEWTLGMTVQEKNKCLSKLWKERNETQRRQKNLIDKWISNNH